MSQNIVLVWFRNDLRLSDNPAFREAVDSGLGVAAAYILDDDKHFSLGGESRWWLHQSLNSPYTARQLVQGLHPLLESLAKNGAGPYRAARNTAQS